MRKTELRTWDEVTKIVEGNRETEWHTEPLDASSSNQVVTDALGSQEFRMNPEAEEGRF